MKTKGTLDLAFQEWTSPVDIRTGLHPKITSDVFHKLIVEFKDINSKIIHFKWDVCEKISLMCEGVNVYL